MDVSPPSNRPPQPDADASLGDLSVSALHAKLKEEQHARRVAAARAAMWDMQVQRELHSKNYRIASLLRRLIGRPRHYSARDLVPGLDLQRGDTPTHWIADGPDPQFLLGCDIPIGWMRIQLKLSTPERCQIVLFADTGNGFNPAETVPLGYSGPDFSCDLFYPVAKPIRALRLDPLDTAGQFTLHHFSVKPARAATVYTRAFLSQCRTSQANGYLGLTLKKGASHLFRGDVDIITRKVISRCRNVAGTPASNQRHNYDLWLENHRMTDPLRDDIRDQIDTFPSRPLLSVIMPVFNPPEEILRSAIDSVRRQLYPDWELCIADDHSTAPHVRRLLEEYAAEDPRIKLTFRPESGGISAASNSAIALAAGDFLAFLDHDDELAEHALFSVAREILHHPDADLIYSDEDKIDLHGKRSTPFFKPDWSPDYFRSLMYTCHLSCYRASLVREIGGLRSEYDGAQDYDLALRFTARTQNVRHIPDVLYHWRTIAGSTAAAVEAKPHAIDAARRALAYHLQETGEPGAIEPVPNTPGYHRIRYHIRGNPRVSIVIPSACRPITNGDKKSWLALQCIRSIRELSTYENLEIVLVHDHNLCPELAAALKPYNVLHISFTDKFNFSAKVNLGARHATGDYLLFLNDDIEVITPDWIERMLGHAQRPGIGAVGARLLFPSGNLQHVGVLLLPYGPDHAYYNQDPNDPGYFACNILTHNNIAVTGACLLMSRQNFRLLDGWNTGFPLNFNDVDLCLRLLEHNLRMVLCPDAELRHHESITKNTSEKAVESILRECDVFLNAWRDRYPRDPYYNPNLSPSPPFYLPNPEVTLQQKLRANALPRAESSALSLAR